MWRQSGSGMRVRIFLLVLAILLPLFSACGKQKAGTFPEIYILDVGQGDCTLLRTADGDILIDAGPESCQEALCRRLRALGITFFEAVIFTHPDEDHIGGGDAVLTAFSARSVWMNGADSQTDSFHRLNDTIARAGIPTKTVAAGDHLSIGGVTLTVLSPSVGMATDENNGSLVISLRCEHFSVLLMGDAGKEAELALLRNYPDAQLRSDILHVGHHGADSSSCEEFLQAVSPRQAIVSCGAGNIYGHPDGRLLARLEQTGTEVFRTDLLGEIHVYPIPDGYEIAGKKSDNKE